MFYGNQPDSWTGVAVLVQGVVLMDTRRAEFRSNLVQEERLREMITLNSIATFQITNSSKPEELLEPIPLERFSIYY
jgi:hypothetical protein